MLYGEPSKIFPYGICTDCCFAFINSIQSVFNMLTLNEYLDFTYEFLFNGTSLQPCLKVFSFLDSVHFLKIIADKTKKMKIEKYVKVSFNLMFTILQNCIKIEEFKQNYEYLIKVLLIPKKNEIFKEAFNALNGVLKNRESNTNENNDVQTNEESNEETNENDDDVIVCDEESGNESEEEIDLEKKSKTKIKQTKSTRIEKTIREQSKFHKFFENFMNEKSKR